MLVVGAGVAGGCGGKTVEGAADGQTEAVSGETPLGELSRDENRSVCEELSLLRNDDVLAVVCRHYGIWAIEQQLPATDDLARSACEQAYQDCLDVDPCAELPLFADDCLYNVAQYRQCVAEHLDSQFEAYQELPLCSGATKDTPAEYAHVIAPYTELCWEIFACYSGVEPGGD